MASYLVSKLPAAGTSLFTALRAMATTAGMGKGKGSSLAQPTYTYLPPGSSMREPLYTPTEGERVFMRDPAPPRSPRAARSAHSGITIEPMARPASTKGAKKEQPQQHHEADKKKQHQEKEEGKKAKQQRAELPFHAISGPAPNKPDTKAVSYKMTDEYSNQTYTVSANHSMREPKYVSITDPKYTQVDKK